MLTVFGQVFGLIIFSLVGYLLSKCKIVNPSHSVILSKLLVWVFLPCNIFGTFAKNCTPKYISENYMLLISSVVTVVILAVVMHFVSKLMTKNKYQRRVYEYSLVVPNNGYMGYPISEAIWGEAGKTNAIFFSLPLSAYIYTYGFCILTKRGLSFKKLLNPVIITMALGMLAGLIEIPIPDYAFGILDTASRCMGPTSMLLAGIVISEFKLKSLLTNVSTYITAVLRLLVIPLAVGGILKLVNAPQVVLSTAVLLFSMPCGLNSIVFPKAIGEDCRAGAGIALITTILSCATIPLVLFIFGINVGL